VTGYKFAELKLDFREQISRSRLIVDPIVHGLLEPAMDGCPDDCRPWILTRVDFINRRDSVGDLTVTGTAYLTWTDVSLQRTWAPVVLPNNDFGESLSEDFRKAVGFVLDGLNHQATGVS
jgi:hypothetical protein